MTSSRRIRGVRRARARGGSDSPEYEAADASSATATSSAARPSRRTSKRMRPSAAARLPRDVGSERVDLTARVGLGRPAPSTRRARSAGARHPRPLRPLDGVDRGHARERLAAGTRDRLRGELAHPGARGDGALPGRRREVPSRGRAAALVPAAAPVAQRVCGLADGDHRHEDETGDEHAGITFFPSEAASASNQAITGELIQPRLVSHESARNRRRHRARRRAGAPRRPRRPRRPPPALPGDERRSRSARRVSPLHRGRRWPRSERARARRDSRRGVARRLPPRARRAAAGRSERGSPHRSSRVRARSGRARAARRPLALRLGAQLLTPERALGRRLGGDDLEDVSCRRSRQLPRPCGRCPRRSGRARRTGTRTATARRRSRARAGAGTTRRSARHRSSSHPRSFAIAWSARKSVAIAPTRWTRPNGASPASSRAPFSSSSSYTAGSRSRRSTEIPAAVASGFPESVPAW